MKICTRAVLVAVPACALAAAAPGGIILGENLLNNHDAEALPGGSGQVVPMPGWSVTSGLFTVAAYGAAATLLDAADPGPANRGNNYFSGGGSALSVAEQRYNLFPLAGAIDSGQLSFTLSGWLGAIAGENDGASLSVTFLDAALVDIDSFAIGTITRGELPAGGLTMFDTMNLIPLGAREAVVELTFTSSGVGSAFNDGAADELSFVIVPSPGPLALFGLAGLVANRRRR